MADLKLYIVTNVPHIFKTEKEHPREFYVLECSEGDLIKGQVLFSVLNWNMAEFGIPDPIHPITKVVRDIITVWPDINVPEYKLKSDHEFDKELEELKLEEVEINETNIDITSSLRNSLQALKKSCIDSLKSGAIKDGVERQSLFIIYQFCGLIQRALVKKFREIADQED